MIEVGEPSPQLRGRSRVVERERRDNGEPGIGMVRCVAVDGIDGANGLAHPERRGEHHLAIHPGEGFLDSAIQVGRGSESDRHSLTAR